ncbi:hypothetical protein VTO42DRAFT_2373 [Malbranchea cinnamomea]
MDTNHTVVTSFTDVDLDILQHIDNSQLLYFCWRSQTCAKCLSSADFCSWCPFSGTCVPNPSRLPLLAPISNASICPLGSKERWELRSQPLGCNVSTLTFLACVMSVLGTLVLVAMGLIVREFGAWAVRRAGRRKVLTSDATDAGVSHGNAFRWAGRFGGDRWRRLGRRRTVVGALVGERSPLLG